MAPIPSLRFSRRPVHADFRANQDETRSVEALSAPSATAGEPGLPTSVRVDDAALADRVRALLDPLDVPTELVSSLPLLDEAVASLDAHLGGGPDAVPPQPFAWDVDAALLPPLYEATAAYARRAPWEYMADHPPLRVALGSDGPQGNVRSLYGCILGAAGMVQGIAFYYSLAAMDRAMDRGEAMLATDELIDSDLMDEVISELRRSGAPVDQIPPEVLGMAVAQPSDPMEAEGGPPHIPPPILSLPLPAMAKGPCARRAP